MTEGPYKLPAGWRWVRLGEVLVLKNGRFIRKSELQENGNIRVYGSNGLLGYVNGRKPMVTQDTIVIGRVGACGAVNWVEAPAWVSDNAMFVAKWLQPCDLKYVFLAIRQADLASRAKKGAQPSISQDEVYNTLIPLPPLEEQKRIVARVEELMARVREAHSLRKEAHQDADRLWQAVLAETFPKPGQDLPTGWRWVRLGEVAKREATLLKPSNYPWKRFRYIGMEHVVAGQWEEPEGVEVSGDEIKSQVVVFRPGLVLYGKLRPYLNKVVVPHTEGVASTEFVPIAPLPDVLDPEYLGAFLRTPSFVAYATANTTGSRQPRIRLDALWSALIPLPPLEEQRRIVAHLEAVRERIKTLKDAQANMEAELKRLEQAILDKAFRGEL